MTADRRRTVVHLILLTALALLFTWPALVQGIPDMSHDGNHHARWAKNFSLQLWQGEWYPRWLSDTNGGLGAPSFFFYPPVASYGASLFRPLLVSHDPDGWMMAGWSAVLAVVLSSVTAYFWLRDLTSPSAALFGAVLYVITPYHLAMDFYIRGALAELWAFVWMPLVLWAVKRCVNGARAGIPALALSYGLLVLTHLPTVLCFSWVIPLAVWMMTEPRQRVPAFLRTLAAVVLGIGLGAIYLLPAMFDQWKSWMGTVDSERYFYQNNFLFRSWGLPLQFETGVLILMLMMVLCAALLYRLIYRFEEDSNRRRLALLYLIAGAIAMFMMAPLSVPIYEVFRFVQKIQFPWRFAGTLTVALAAIAALAFLRLFSKATSRVVPLIVAVLIVSWAGVDVWAASKAFSGWRHIPEDRLVEHQKWISLQSELFTQWPRPADSLRLSSASEAPALEAFLEAHQPRSLALSRAEGTAVVGDWRPRQIAIFVHLPENEQLTVGHFYYPDWRAHIQNSGQSLAVTPSPEGLLQVDAPRGDYSLILLLVRDTPERAGIWISSVSLLLICGLTVMALSGTANLSRKNAAAIQTG